MPQHEITSTDTTRAPDALSDIYSAEKVLLAPHNDDEALFASFICLREKPLVVIITDSQKQFDRGEHWITADVRRQETLTAMKTLGCRSHFLGIPDTKLDHRTLKKSLSPFRPKVVYAPAIQGGNKQHDLVGLVALELFKNVVQYSTYSQKELYTTGDEELLPTPDELRLKEVALSAYKTQVAYHRTAPHFAAVRGKSEWITKDPSYPLVKILWQRFRM